MMHGFFSSELLMCGRGVYPILCLSVVVTVWEVCCVVAAVY